MTNLNQATLLYIKGYNGSYILSKTGISIQKLIKTNKSHDVIIDKNDIISFQTNHIKQHDTKEDIESAYKNLIMGTKEWIDAGCPDSHLWKKEKYLLISVEQIISSYVKA